VVVLAANLGNRYGFADCQTKTEPTRNSTRLFASALREKQKCRFHAKAEAIEPPLLSSPAAVSTVGGESVALG
jgi:hypothetical protein